MSIKQIKAFLFIFTLVVSTVGGVLVTTDTAQAYTCPNTADGTPTEFHESDNSCWIYGLPSGCVRENDRNCQKEYTRTNLQPTYEDGSNASFSCPAGQEYHASDNKCWSKETKPGANGKDCTGSGWEYSSTEKRCVKYTERGNPGISPDLKAEYCGSNFPQETEACKKGQAEGDCSSYTNPAQKEACAEGYATALCGVNDGTGTANSADARQSCYNEVKECMNKPQAEQKACLDGVSGVDDEELNKNPPGQTTNDGTGINCGEAETVLISCEGTGVAAIGDVLRIIITVMTVIIGIAAVGGLAWASILYAKAQDNEGNVQESRTLIRNIIIGIALYGFLVAIINWLVPGGVIG